LARAGEVVPVIARKWPLPGRTLLVTRVNPRQYGHLALEIAMSLLHGRREHAAVYFLRPRRVVSSAMFRMISDEVRVVPRAVALDWAVRLFWWVGDARAWVAGQAASLTRALQRAIRAELSTYERSHQIRPRVRRALLHVKEDLRPPVPTRVQQELPLYYQRRLLRDHVPVRVDPRAVSAVRAAAARVGLDPDLPMVTLHVRESGFKFGREMHDAKPGGRDDSTRNARIESYFAAIDLIVSRGYTVVRVGDPSMRPVARPGLVDLATAAARSQLLEVYCMSRSRFFVSAEAGPVGLAYLTGTPLLTVNATDPISSYPIRGDGLLLLKHVRDRRTGRELSAAELVGREHLTHLRDVLRYEYVDNTGEEIVEAVTEMFESLEGRAEETEAQRRYREIATEAGEQFRPVLHYVRKWGSDRGFLGNGRVGREYAERHL
jgi:putative glycosyltransferase (TIGR04372 family)